MNNSYSILIEKTLERRIQGPNPLHGGSRPARSSECIAQGRTAQFQSKGCRRSPQTSLKSALSNALYCKEARKTDPKATKVVPIRPYAQKLSQVLPERIAQRPEDRLKAAPKLLQGTPKCIAR